MGSSTSRACRVLVALTVVRGLVTTASAQWTVDNLHPPGADISEAFGADGGHQVGYAAFDAGGHALAWSGAAGSYVDLHPLSAYFSYARAAADGEVVGRAGGIDGVNHASLWTGTAASWIDLNPAGASESQAVGVSGGRQVGWAKVNGVSRASLWSGSAATWVDLTPAGYDRSRRQRHSRWSSGRHGARGGVAARQPLERDRRVVGGSQSDRRRTIRSPLSSRAMSPQCS